MKDYHCQGEHSWRNNRHGLDEYYLRHEPMGPIYRGNAMKHQGWRKPRSLKYMTVVTGLLSLVLACVLSIIVQFNKPKAVPVQIDRVSMLDHVRSTVTEQEQDIYDYFNNPMRYQAGRP